jgi:hypothetical protein
VEIENEAGSFDDGSVSRVHQGQRHCSLVGLLLCTWEAMQVSRGLAGGGAAVGIQEARDGGCSPLRRSERRRPELFPAACRERPAARERCCCRGGTWEGGGRRAGGDESRESDGLGPAALGSREPEGRRGRRGSALAQYIGDARVARTPRKWRRRAAPKLDQAGHM